MVRMSAPALVILAAGVGSRYGGPKQIEPLGPGGATLLDYSVYFEPKSFSLPNTYAVMADGAFHLFDVTKLNEAPRAFQIGFEVNDWAGSPDGRIIAAAASSGMVRLWDVATLQPLATLKGFLLGAHSVAFSPDGRRLVAGSSGRGGGTSP